MATKKQHDNLKFRSQVGHQPWFFVPDTGTPGGTAVLSGPAGDVDCVNTQITLKDRTWPDGTVAKGVGFEVPGIFMDEGEYTLTVTQDRVVTVYEIDVYLDLVDLAAKGGPAFGLLNQMRQLAGRKPFTLAADVTASGYTDRELVELDRLRTNRGLAALEG